MARLRRKCKRCGKMFTPTGKFSKLCNECLDKARKKK